MLVINKSVVEQVASTAWIDFKPLLPAYTTQSKSSIIHSYLLHALNELQLSKHLEDTTGNENFSTPARKIKIWGFVERSLVYDQTLIKIELSLLRINA
jgi:hypothetical protein